MKKLIIVLCFLFLLFVLWMSRYTIFPTSREWVYKLDRFTGKVTILIFNMEQEIKESKEKDEWENRFIPEDEFEKYRRK